MKDIDKAERNRRFEYNCQGFGAHVNFLGGLGATVWYWHEGIKSGLFEHFAQAINHNPLLIIAFGWFAPALVVSELWSTKVLVDARTVFRQPMTDKKAMSTNKARMLLGSMVPGAQWLSRKIRPYHYEAKPRF